MLSLREWEWRDCVGVKKYVDSYRNLDHTKVALFSQCVDGISQYKAIARYSELFENMRALCSPMVPTPEGLIERTLQRMGLPKYRELVDLELLKF